MSTLQTRRRRYMMLYNMLAGGEPPIDWLLRVEFSTDRGAIGSGTYAGEVGEVTITDTGNNVTISSGAARFTNVFANGDPKFSYALTRAQGLMSSVYFSAIAVRTLVGIPSFFIDTSANPAAANLFDGSANITDGLIDGALGADQSLTFVMQSTGTYLFRDLGAGIKLAWVRVSGTSSGDFNFNAVSTSGLRELDYMRVRQLEGAAWTTLNGLASVNVSSPASGASSTATADAIHDIAFTLDGTPTANEKVELRYRVQDASNYWTAYMERNAGNTAWDVKLDSVSAGVATNRISVTGVTATRLRVIVDQSLHDVFTLSGTTWTKRGGQINVSHLNSETAINATYAAGNTVSTLISFPRTSSEYEELSRT